MGSHARAVDLRDAARPFDDTPAENDWNVARPLLEAAIELARMNSASASVRLAKLAIGPIMFAAMGGDEVLLSDFARAISRAEKRRWRVRAEEGRREREKAMPNVVDLLGWLKRQVATDGAR